MDNIKSQLKEIQALLLINNTEIKYIKKRVFEKLGIDDSDPYRFANELDEMLKDLDNKRHLLFKDYPHTMPAD